MPSRSELDKAVYNYTYKTSEVTTKSKRIHILQFKSNFHNI